MPSSSGRSLGSFLFLSLLFLSGNLGAQQEFRLSGQDYYEQVFRVEETGMVSIQVTSGLGASVELIDRMAGSLVTEGSAGYQDGRIDQILDAGEYKVILRTWEETTPITLLVNEFQEINSEEEKRVFLDWIPGEFLRTDLEDYQSRSYWINIEEDPLVLEALGRNIGNSALWKDGQFILPNSPTSDLRSAEEGRPMRYIEYHQELESGLYLLTFYGSAQRGWEREQNTKPLYIRKGIRNLGEAIRTDLVISPFGRDSYLTAGQTDFFTISSEDYSPLGLSISGYRPTQSRHRSSRSLSVNEDSTQNWQSLSYTIRSQGVLTITGIPRDTAGLVFGSSRQYYYVDGEDKEERYFVSTISTMESENALDLSLIASEDLEVLDSGAISIDINQPFSRRINLLDTNTLILDIPQEGTYKILESESFDGKGEYGVISAREYGRSRPTRYFEAQEDIFFPQGLVVLYLRPKNRGILHFSLFFSGGMIWETPGREAAARASFVDPPVSPRQDALLPSVEPRAGLREDVSLYINDRHNVRTHLFVRAYPLDLREPLPFSLMPGENLKLPLTLEEDQRFSIRGTGFRLTDRGTYFTSGTTLTKGSHEMEIVNTSITIQYYQAYLEDLPPQVIPPVEIPPLEETVLALRSEEPYFGDFDREETKRFLLTIDQPSFYNLQTTGRLATMMNVRTATLPGLYQATQNGVGRNSSIFTYLRPGEYLLEVSTLGQSTGRAGVHATLIRPQLAGALQQGVVDRQSLESGEALYYQIPVTEEARYRVSSLGMYSRADTRLEDEESWPVGPALSGSDRSLELREGNYRLYSLGRDTANRRLTRFDVLADSVVPEGNLPLGGQVNGEWNETPSRDYHRFELSVPAHLPVRIGMSMGLEVRVLGENNELIWSGAEENSIELQLRQGLYRIELRSKEEQNRLSYTLSAQTPWLVPDGQISINSSSVVNFNLPEKAFVQLWSYGSSDLQARLLNEDDRVLAHSDDGRDDWNFHISTSLEAGNYRVEVDSAGYTSGFSILSLDTFGENILSSGSLPISRGFLMDQDILTLPLDVPQDGFYLFKVQTPYTAEIEVFSHGSRIARGVGQLYLPLQSGNEITLRVWGDALDGTEIFLEAKALTGRSIGLGTELSLSPGEAIQIRNPDQEAFHLQTTGDLLFSPGEGIQAKEPGVFPLVTMGTLGYLVNDSQKDQSFQLERLRIPIGRTVAFSVGSAGYRFSMESAHGAVSLLEVRSNGAKAGLFARSGTENPSLLEASWYGSQLESSRTIMGLPPGEEFQGLLWNTQQDTLQRFDLEHHSFPLGNSSTYTGQGVMSLEVPPGEAMLIDIPAGLPAVQLLLSPEMAAFSVKGQQPWDMIASDSSNTQGVLLVPEEAFYVLNRTSSYSFFRIGAAGLEETITTLRPDQNLEILVNPDEQLSFEIQASGEKRIFVSGNFDWAQLKAPSGEILDPMPLDDFTNIFWFDSSSGILEVNTKQGYLSVWRGHEGDLTPFIGKPSQPSGTLNLGFMELSGFVQEWSLQLDSGQYVRIDSESPGLTALYSSGDLLQMSVGREGWSLFTYLEPGLYRVITRPLATGNQDSGLLYNQITPIPLSNEDAVLSWFIGRGEQQVFRFQLNSNDNVGIGLAPERDLITGSLYDAQFNELGRGRYFYRRFPPGEYFLVVEGGEMPVKYRVILLGEDGSRTGVPQDVVESYTGE